MKVAKHIYLLSILVLSVCSKVYAQNTFLKHFRYGNPESNCQGWSLAETSNGNIIVQFGYLDNFSLGLDFGFYTLNKYGDSLNTNVYHIEGDDFVDQILLDDNSTLYTTGARKGVGSQYYDGVLYKIDLIDSINNEFNFYNNAEGDYSISGVLKSQSNLYLTGYKNSISTSLNFNIQKSDLNGVLNFDSSYFASKADFSFASSFDKKKHNILMCGGSYTGSTDQARVMAMKVDTNGNEQWRIYVGIENDNFFECRSIGNSILEASNSAYYIAGFTDNWCDSNLWTRGYNHSLLIKLDSNGNLLWSKKEKFVGFREQSYQNVFNTLDGNIICIGNAATLYDTTTLTENYDVLITKYDLNGNVIWHREYGHPDFYEFVYKSAQTKDGGFLITGRYENINNPFYDVQTYVMKLDDCGCLVPGCDPNCIASGTSNSIKQNTIKVYPNPTNNYLTIESDSQIESYVIYNIIGDIQQKGLYSESIDVSKLSNGMYIIKLEHDNKFSTLKFVKNQ